MRKSKTKNKIYFADFETTTPKSEQFKKEGHTNVWLWNIAPTDSDDDCDNVYGNKLDDFMKWIEHDYESKTIYFHNLSFDGQFIFKWLIRNKPDWFYQESLDQKRKYNYFKVFRKNNKFYSIEIVYRKRTKFNKKVLFAVKLLCSYNLIPSSINSLGDAFGFQKMNKNDIEWLINKKYIKNEREFYDLGGDYVFKDRDLLGVFVDYIKRDVLIAKTAWREYRRIIEDNNSDAINSKYGKKNVYLQNTLTSASLTQKLIKNHIYNSKHISAEIKKEFRLKQHDEYSFAHKFYGGGFSQFNPQHHNRLFNFRGFSIDINSSYPFSMTKKLPYGSLTKDKPDGDYLTYVVVDIDFTIKSKYENIPCIKDLTKIKRYASSGSGVYYFLEDEFILYKKIYNIKINKIDYYYSKASDYLKSFINKYYQLKVDADKNKNKPMKNTYKLLLNSLYGGFGKKASYPELLFIDEWLYDELKNNKDNTIFGSKYELKPVSFSLLKLETLRKKAINFDVLKEIKAYPNLLVGATITAYSRILLIESILTIGINNFVYCDTDSIFFKWNKKITDLPPAIKIDDYELGAWKVEFEFVRGKILGSKRYVFENDSKKIKKGTCGITKLGASTFDEMEKILNDGFLVVDGKFQRKEDDYGIYLEEKDVQLNLGKN